MDKHELLTLAASNIAGGMAAAAYGKTPNADDVVKKSLEIARKIEEGSRAG
jgi:hypothetical protein